MKQTILLIIFFSIHILSALGEQPITVNPVNLGFVLVEEPTEEGMVRICKGCNLTELPAENGFHVYTTVDVKLRFKKISGEEPVVEIYSTKKLKNIKETLYKAGYYKAHLQDSKKAYIHGSQLANRYTVCNLLNSKTLTLTKVSTQ